RSRSLAPRWTCTCSTTLMLILPVTNDGSTSYRATITYCTNTPSFPTRRASDLQTPGLTLVKAASPATYSLGTVITYTYTVTNSGKITLTAQFSINSDNEGTILCGNGTLAPIATTTCTATYTADLADLKAGSLPN